MADEISYSCDKCGAKFPSGRHLGGHRKTHNLTPTILDFEKLGPTPDCFDSTEDWEDSLQRLSVENPHKRTFTRDYALSQACRACTRDYQEEQQKVGACHPPADAMTPLRILEEGIVLEEDE